MTSALRHACVALMCLPATALLLVLPACRQKMPPLSLAERGITVIDPLQGEAATNQARMVELLRHSPTKTAWERRTFTSPKTKQQLKYLLFKPAALDSGTNLPLVLSLHGGASRQDFESLLDPVNGHTYGLGRLVSNETQQKYPSFVFAPWSHGQGWDGSNIALILETLDALQSEFRIDPKRIYVVGQSMGGFGTWRIITMHPNRFAAAVPICGGGTPTDAPRAKNIPIWAFHGTADDSVPVDYTREMILALRKAGANPRYWEYLGGTHAGTAERAYCEPELMDWLFAQTRP